MPDVTGYHAAHIIDDDFLYGLSSDPFHGGLTTAQVQDVLDQQGGYCLDGPRPCLKAHQENTPTVPSDGGCSAYSGVVGESVAAMITKVGVACGIGQKALVSLLQAKSGMVTDSVPEPEDYSTAYGLDCTVATDCDTFFGQLYGVAHRLRLLSGDAGSPTAPVFPVGSSSDVPFSSAPGCGSTPIVIENKATAALYSLTPTQPNGDALKGNRDAPCASLVNLDFWATYSDWFGPTRAGAFADGFVAALTAADHTIHSTGWAVDPSSPEVPISIRFDVTSPSGTISHVTAMADQTSSAAAARHPEAGAAHGFDAAISAVAPGPYQICAFALPGPDNTRRDPSHLGCRLTVLSSLTEGSVDQVAEATRIDVALAIADRSYPYPETVPVVYVATGYNYPDALSAGPAAGHQGGPLLLTTGDTLSGQVTYAIQRLRPQKVVVVGGPNSVSPPVFEALKALQPNIVRLGGADRYEASRNVVDYAFGDSGADSAFVVTGANFPDALSAGGAAGAADAPVLLTNGAASSIDSATAGLLGELNVKAITVVGGAASVREGVVDALGAIAPTKRLSGSDRFAASVAVNSTFTTSTEAFLATGLNYPDALAGSAWAGHIGAPLYVVQQDCVPPAVLSELTRLGVDHVTLLGGLNTLRTGVRNLDPCS